MGFFTVYDGDFRKYVQDFADKRRLFSMLSFHMSLMSPPTSVAKNATRSYQSALESNQPPSGSTAPIQASRFRH